MPLEYRRLGKSGLKVPTLCLGTMTFGESAGFMKGVTSDEAEARKVFDVSLERGIDFLDTADMYSEGRSEELLGQWIGPRRHRLILATKCRFPMGPGPNDVGLSRGYIVKACEASLRRLKSDYIDLYQMHMQDGSVRIEETLSALDDLRRSGKIRYAACSNFTGYRLAESMAVSEKRNLAQFESVQLQWNLVERGAEREMIPACRAFNLGVLVWSPLARGVLSGKYKKDMAPPAGSRLAEWKDTWRKVNTPKTWEALDAVEKVAKETDSTPARVALAWLLHKPEVTSVILGARTVQQLEDNLAATQVKLSPAQLQLLDKASEPAWGYPYDFIAMREPW